MKKKNTILEQDASLKMDDGAKLKMANEKGCYPKWLKGGQLGNYKGKKTWYGKNDKGETVCFYADMTAENIQTKKTSNWTCEALSQTIGTTQDVSKLTPNQQLQVSDQKMKDEGWTEDIPVDPENWDVYTKIPGITLYRQKALSNIRPDQIEKLKLVLKEKGYTLRQPDYGTPEYDYSKTNPAYLSTVLDKYDAEAIGITDLSTKIYKLDISDTAPKKKEDVKKDIAAIKNAPRYTALECKTNIENLYNNSPSTTKKPRKFTPLTDEYAIEDAKNIVMACIAQQGIDGFTVGRGYDAGLFGVSTDDQVRQLVRDKGRYGLKFKYDNWKTSQRTATNESIDKELKSIIRENLTTLSETKKKGLIQESKIVKNRFRIISESYNPKTKKGKKEIVKQIFNETAYLHAQGFDKNIINEGFWESLTGIFGKGTDSIFQYFKEYAAKWLLEKFNVNSDSWIGNIVIAAVGNLDLADIPKLTDCNFVTKLLSKSLAEGAIRKLQNQSVGSGPLQDILRNTIVEVLEGTDLGMKIESALGSVLCPLISKLSGKMDAATQEIKSKALGVDDSSKEEGLLSKLGGMLKA